MSNPTPGHIARQDYTSKRYVHSCVHSNTIHNSWKQSKCPLTNEQTKNVWHIHTVKYSLEKGLATHANIPAWRVPWTEEPGGLQSM